MGIDHSLCIRSEETDDTFLREKKGIVWYSLGLTISSLQNKKKNIVICLHITDCMRNNFAGFFQNESLMPQKTNAGFFRTRIFKPKRTNKFCRFLSNMETLSLKRRMRNYNIVSIMPLTDKRRYYVFDQTKEGITSLTKLKREFQHLSPKEKMKEKGKVEIGTEWK